MGIKNLMKLLKDEAPDAIKEIKLKNLTDRKIAIDASIQLYQYFVMIRTTGNSNGLNSMLMSNDGRVTSHIQGFFNRTIKLLEMGIRPIYIFDGKPPELKIHELQKRKKTKDKAKGEIETLKTKLETTNESELLDVDIEKEITDEINKLEKRNIKVTKEHNDEVKRLLNLMGVPVIEASGEAEASCAALARAGLVYGSATEDLDVLTFQTPIMLKKLTFSGNKPIEEIILNKVLKQLELTIDQFIDLCILCGCDYATSVKGIGPKTAYKLIKKHKNLESVFEHIKKNTKYEVPEELEFGLDEIRDLFHNPDIIDVETVKINFKPPDVEGLKHYLITELNFNQERVDKGIVKLIKYSGNKPIQKSITSFFKHVK
jgi:flap endonuclease-1